jgi:RNA polymerase sigma-70 factor, ECF subfamily
MMVDDEVQRQLPQLLPRLWRFALRLTRNVADAEDLMQRSCLRALERRAQWRPENALLSWLFAITHSIWMNELRAVQRRREGSLFASSGEQFMSDVEPSEREFADVDQSTDPEQRLLCKQIVEAVDGLNDAQRVVMLMVAVEGFSYRETAELLDVPIGTVMSRLARARVTIGERFLERKHHPLGDSIKEHSV